MKQISVLHSSFFVQQLRTPEVLKFLQKIKFDCDSLFCGLKDTTFIFMEEDIYLGITSPLPSSQILKLSQRIVASKALKVDDFKKILDELGLKRALVVRKTSLLADQIKKCDTLWGLVNLQMNHYTYGPIIQSVPQNFNLFFHPLFPTFYNGLQIFLNQFCKPEENILIGIFENKNVIMHLLVQIKDRKIYKISQNSTAHQQLDNVAHDWQNILKKGESDLGSLFQDSDLLGLFIDAAMLDDCFKLANPLSGFLRQLIQGKHLFIHPSLKLRLMLYQQIAKNFFNESFETSLEE